MDDPSITGAAQLLEADLLPGWDEERLLLDRERHRQLRIHALARLSELLTSRGHYGRAIDVACAAVRVEPLHEFAHAALIAAHMAEGNRAETISHFRAYGRLLDEEAGLEPSPRLTELLVPKPAGASGDPARVIPGQSTDPWTSGRWALIGGIIVVTK